MRKIILSLLLLCMNLPAFSQMVGSDITKKEEKKDPKPQKTFVISDGILLNYEFFPSAIFKDAAIGVTYYHIEEWGYYGNLMFSVGGPTNPADYSSNLSGDRSYYIPKNSYYKTAGFSLRLGGMYQLSNTYVPYFGMGYRHWNRNWVLGNGKLVTEKGDYQNDVCIEGGCLFRFETITCSAGIVGYFNDTFSEGVTPNFKIGIGYEF